MKLKFPLICLALLALSACSESNLAGHFIKQWNTQQEAGTYKIGKPYQVGSVQYTPQESFDLVETGIASWYGPDFHGGRTANGEIYDQNELTAAHRTLQMPSFVRVTNLENGRSVVVRVNDRGPYLHGRIIDVSKRAAELLDFTGKGTARVRLEVLGKESRQIADAAKRGQDTSRMTLADFQRMSESAPPVTVASSVTSAPMPALAPARGPRLASLSNDADALPESLQTPTITVEELAAPGSRPGTAPAPTWTSPQKPPSGIAAAPRSIPVHVDQKGLLMPDPVVTTEPVRPTGIFVQAGSFAVYDNADRLSKKLSKIAHASIDTVTVGGRRLYRVKLGPLPSVSVADATLEKVIHAGTGGAKVIKN